MGNLINDQTTLTPVSTPGLDIAYAGRRFLVGADASLAALPGFVFGNGGQSKYTALVSAAAAYAKAVTGRGDTVLMGPNHIEPAMIAAGTLTVSKTDLTFAGLPSTNRGNKPTFKFTTAAGASLLVTGARTRLKNLFFNLTGIDALTGPLTIDAADCIVEDCDFLLTKSAATAAQAVYALVTTANANRLRIRNCRFFAEVGDTNAGATAAICIVGGENIHILDNVIDGYFTAGVGGINNITTATKHCRLDNNEVNNRTSAASALVTWLAASTPIIGVGNRGRGGNSGSAGILTTAASNSTPHPAWGVGPNAGIATGDIVGLNYFSNTEAVIPTAY